MDAPGAAGPPVSPAAPGGAGETSAPAEGARVPARPTSPASAPTAPADPFPAADPPDAVLLARVAGRDEAALGALYDRYGGLVFTVALRVLGDRHLAEEVMQDAFLRCWDGAAGYRPELGQAGGWLVGIGRNRAVDVLRSRQHQARLREGTALPESGTPGAPGVPDLSDAIATRDAVAASLACLTLPQRQVVELAYYGGLTQTEIARELSTPLGTIKTRTRTAMDRLREALRPDIATGADAPVGDPTTGHRRP